MLNTIQNHRIIQPLTKQQIQQSTNKRQTNSSFKDSLDGILNKDDSSPLNISKHAAKRMDERNINIEPEQWQRIYDKLQEAKAMGIKDSLVVTNHETMVVNAENNTVITVMNREEAQSHIFSNINGTILLDD